MLVDAIKDIKNIITISPNYYRASHKMAKTTFSLFEDFNETMFWEINEPDDINHPENNFAWINVDFTETIKVNEFVYKVTASTVPFVNCYYSFEGNVWEEFPYFTYQVRDTAGLTDLQIKTLSLYQTTVFKKIKSNTEWIYTKDVRGVTSTTYEPFANFIYVPYNPLSKTTVALTADEYIILSEIFDDLFKNKNRNIIDFKYEFTYINPATNSTEYIYDNLYIRQMRVEFSQYLTTPVPFRIDQFSMYTPLTIEIEKNIISCFKDSMFKPKYFEDYPFIPSLTGTFIEMLEYSDKEISEKIPTLEIDYAIDNQSFKAYLYSNVEINISRQFEPIYVWTMTVTNRQGILSFARYAYPTVTDRWEEVDSFCYNMITDSNNVKMDMTFSIITNKMTLTKRRVYDLTAAYVGDGWISSIGVGDMIIDQTFYVY